MYRYLHLCVKLHPNLKSGVQKFSFVECGVTVNGKQYFLVRLSQTAQKKRLRDLFYRTNSSVDEEMQMTEVD